MSFSLSGLAYLCGFLGTGLLAYRFFQYHRREKTLISKLFFYIAALFSLFFFSTAVSILFFGENTLALKWAVVIAMFIEGIAGSLIAYLIIYTNFPRVSPWLGFSIFFLLGLIQTGLTIVEPIRPFFEESGSVNWGLSSRGASTVLMVFAFFSFLPIMIILLRQLKGSQDTRVKMKSLGLCIIFGFGLIVVLFDSFLIASFLSVPAIDRDIVIISLSIFLFIFSFFMPKPLPIKEKYVLPSSLPEIKW